MTWTLLIAIIILVIYVHLFNAIATWYLDSDRNLTWNDVWKRIAPPLKVTIQLT